MNDYFLGVLALVFPNRFFKRRPFIEFLGPAGAVSEADGEFVFCSVGD